MLLVFAVFSASFTLCSQHSIMAAASPELDQYARLAQFTTIVVDSGELDAIKKFVPQDATTNPSLLLQACQDPKYDVFVQDVRTAGTMHVAEKCREDVCDRWSL
jgi:hypothetical protein